MEIKIIGMYELNQKEQDAIKDAVELGIPVLNSNVFKLAIIYSTFRENKGYSSKQIYEMIMNGGDQHLDGTFPLDQTMDLDITGFWSASKTIGYTNLRGIKTYINRSFLQRFDASEIFGHIIHEYCHKLDFAHRSWFGRQKSVPYVCGYKARDAFKEFYSRPSLNQVPSALKANVEFQLL